MHFKLWHQSLEHWEPNALGPFWYCGQAWEGPEQKTLCAPNFSTKVWHHSLVTSLGWLREKKLSTFQTLAPKFGVLRIFFLMAFLILKFQGLNFIIFDTKLWNDERIFSSFSSNFFKLNFEVWNSKRFCFFMHEKWCRTQNMDFKRLFALNPLKFGNFNYLLFGF